MLTANQCTGETKPDSQLLHNPVKLIMACSVVIPCGNLQNIMCRRHENRDPMLIGKYCSDDWHVWLPNLRVVLGPQRTVKTPTNNPSRCKKRVDHPDLSNRLGMSELVIPMHQRQGMKVKRISSSAIKWPWAANSWSRSSVRKNWCLTDHSWWTFEMLGNDSFKNWSPCKHRNGEASNHGWSGALGLGTPHSPTSNLETFLGGDEISMGSSNRLSPRCSWWNNNLGWRTTLKWFQRWWWRQWPDQLPFGPAIQWNSSNMQIANKLWLRSQKLRNSSIALGWKRIGESPDPSMTTVHESTCQQPAVVWSSTMPGKSIKELLVHHGLYQWGHTPLQEYTPCYEWGNRGYWRCLHDHQSCRPTASGTKAHQVTVLWIRTNTAWEWELRVTHWISVTWPNLPASHQHPWPISLDLQPWVKSRNMAYLGHMCMDTTEYPQSLDGAGNLTYRWKGETYVFTKVNHRVHGIESHSFIGVQMPEWTWTVRQGKASDDATMETFGLKAMTGKPALLQPHGQARVCDPQACKAHGATDLLLSTCLACVSVVTQMHAIQRHPKPVQLHSEGAHMRISGMICWTSQRLVNGSHALRGTDPISGALRTHQTLCRRQGQTWSNLSSVRAIWNPVHWQNLDMLSLDKTVLGGRSHAF